MTKEQAENYRVDKSKWARGPWDSEPDRVDFKHAGFPCLLKRHPSLGHWCAYVGVPPGHPAYGKGYDDVDVEVHGGLTYGGKCSGDICHVPDPGEPDEVFWLGMDFAHGWDFSPGMSRSSEFRDSDETYKTVRYVRNNCKSLAEQLAKMVPA